MAIPKMTDNLNIIQALSDLPNSEDELTAQELKAKFDAAGLAIQNYLNKTLIPALVAAQLPFDKTTAINADTIQAAIENVQSQVQEAATGTIVNGSVTKEKLAQALLSRTYGGLAWVSANTPDIGDNPDTDFPIGQTWIRPEFSVTNDAGENWSATGCTAVKSGYDVMITGLAQASTVKASQSLTGLGNQGDRVRILFTVKDMDSEMSSLTAAVNGTTQSISGDIVLNGTLSANGSLTVEFFASWPSTSLADGSVTLANYTVVNLDKIMRQIPEAKEISDWSAWLRTLLPFTNYKSPVAVFSQEKAGVWTQVAFDVLPVIRGGTGLSTLVPNRYLRTQADGSVGMMSPEDVAEDISALRMMSGSYTGTGKAGSITLPVTPKLLHIYPQDGPFVDTKSTSAIICDNPATLSNGGKQAEKWTMKSGDSYNVIQPYVSLSGNTLTFGKINSYPADSPVNYCNSSGKKYIWKAIY